MAWYSNLALVVQLTILVLIFLFIGVWMCICLYEYCFLGCFPNRRRSSSASSSSSPAAISIITVQVTPSANGGLNQAEIDSFPKLTYQKVDEEDCTKAPNITASTDQCVICLSSFKSDETLRLIPRCGHVFHADCADVWLRSTATCPYCRADLRLPPPLQPKNLSADNLTV